MPQIRVRFAPSPTGALHIGGVRTALYNYLFARHHQGKFVLRIEDTDQARKVEGAEKYIQDALEWLGIAPDESPSKGGEFAPYRQSERLDIYRKYAYQLLEQGKAYYAFDSPEELDAMREKLKAAGVANLNYNSTSRMSMTNSLTLDQEEVKRRIDQGEPYVIRIKVPQQQEIRFEDAIRGWVMVHSVNLDDKVLMKYDGYPTYHLANVVDDHLMKITHVIRGEEWLPSAPLHVLLYEYLGWAEEIPSFAHLPLILKPDGKGKLSKRAATQAGFPIFPISWTDPNSEEFSDGFKEQGYLPDALNNFLALLGWNPGTEQEIFSRKELISQFSLDNVGKAGTKFDIDKAKWFNESYLRAEADEILAGQLREMWENEGIDLPFAQAVAIVSILKPRVSFPKDLFRQSRYFLQDPDSFDEKLRSKKWNDEARKGLELFSDALKQAKDINAEAAKSLFSKTLNDAGLNPGKVMPALRLTLTGQSNGPDLMAIIEIMGPMSAGQRIQNSIAALNETERS